MTVVAFSGCVVETEGTVANALPSESAGATVDPSATSSVPEPNATTEPILAVKLFLADVELPIDNGTYAAPAGSNITFDTTGTTDPDGGELSFAWDFGEGTTSTEASPVFAYALPGNYTTTVVVTDAAKESATASFAFVIEKGGPSPGELVKIEKKTFTGTLNNPTVLVCGSQQGQGEGQLQKTFTWAFTAAEADGTSTIVNHVLLTMTGSATNVDTDIYFYDPAGKELGKSTGSSSVEKIELEQDLQPGTYKIIAKACASVQGTFEIKAEATYVVA